MGITDFKWQFDRRGSLIYASNGYAWIYEGNGYVSHNSYGDIANNYSTYTSGDIIGVALDLDNNKLYFHKNGTYENSGNPTSGSTGTGAISIDAPSSLPSGFSSPLVADVCSATAAGGDVNFGNGTLEQQQYLQRELMLVILVNLNTMYQLVTQLYQLKD